MTEYNYYGSFDDPYYHRTRRVRQDGSIESDTERYWREIAERQGVEYTPEYDPWSGGYF